MKRGTPDHPKTRQLAVLLGLKRYEVVGILESLWHFTASYAKRGDIGRWTNAAIAAALEWSGDADKLMSALITAGFLDADSNYRMLVHDWPDHADQTVSRSEEVKKNGYASKTLAPAGESPATSSDPLTKAGEKLATASIVPQDASQPMPLPKPKPMPCQSRAVAEAVPAVHVAVPSSEPVSPPRQNGSEKIQSTPSASGDSDTTVPISGTLPGPDNFAAAIGIKLRLADIGLTPQGKADLHTFGTIYGRHILPGHLGPPGVAVRLCYNEALRIGEETTRTNKAGTFIGCVKKHLEAAGHDWDE